MPSSLARPLTTLGAAALLAAAASEPARAQSPADSAARVDQIFARFATPQSAGCAVGVGRNGQPVLQRAYGMANLEYGVPNTPETIFEAGSVSKQFTAAAIVLLAERGKVSLEDPVRKYLPELPDYAKEYGRPVTLRLMLNHTSGLRDWGTVTAAAGWPRGSRAHTQAHVLDIASRQRSLNFPPGNEYLYSNTNYNLMAIIVERVSGMPFAEFTRTNLFEPLGMTHTSWRDDYTRVVRGRATGCNVQRDGVHTDMPFENAHGNGGLLTTVGDLLRWNEHLTHPSDAVGGQALVDSMQRRGRLTSGRTITYALGLVVSSYRGVPEVSHSGATAGYRAYLARYPEQRLSVALLCNAGNANPDQLAHQVADVFLGTQAASPSAVAATYAAVPGPELAAKAGLYRNARTGEVMRLLVRNDTLRNAQGGVLLPLSATRFQSPSGQTRAVFEPGPNGRPRGVHFISTEDDTADFVPAADPHLTPATLAQYAGEYESDEAEVTYRVVADSGQLWMRSRPAGRAPLTPAYADAFTMPGGQLVIFRRDAAGKVTGLSLGLGRVRDLRFRKVK